MRRLTVVVLLIAAWTALAFAASSHASSTPIYVYDGDRDASSTLVAGPTGTATDLAFRIRPTIDRGAHHNCDNSANLLSTSARVDGYRLAPRATSLADDVLDLPTSQSWGRLDTLDDHFLRHGADFGARSADDYASQASQFFQRAQQQGLPTRIDSNGVIRVYDPATNTFGAFNPNGTTRTFFKPSSGADYWATQPGSSPWTG